MCFVQLRIAFLGLVFFLLIAEFVALLRVKTLEKQGRRGEIPDFLVSVVVTARNEEDHIGKLFDGLSRQRDRNFELVLVLDRCTDRTTSIAAEFSREAQFPVRVLEHQALPATGTNPKVPALSEGISCAKGPLLLFTDADCRVPDGWIDGYRRQFRDPELGLAFGPVGVSGDCGPLCLYQHFDHMYRYYHAAATVGAGFPTGGFGNNLALRLACYRDLGGFKGLPSSITEDAVLVSAAGSNSRWKVRALTDPSVSVTTGAIESLSGYLSQALRWASGAFFSPYPKTRWAYRILLMLLLLTTAAIPAALIYPPVILFPAAALVYLLASALSASFFLPAGRSYFFALLASIPAFVLVYEITFIVLLFLRRVYWKGQSVYLRGGR